MATGISVRSVAPVVTGDKAVDAVSADIIVDGAASGALTLVFAATPDLSKATSIAYVSQGSAGASGGTIYRVVVPAPGLWYFWAGDSAGTAPLPGAGWPGLSQDRDLNLTGQFLADTLEANLPGIHAALQTRYFPGVSIKQVVYGTSSSIRDFPAILVSKPRESSDWVALPLIREHTYRFEIFLFLLHQDTTSLVPVGVQFAASVASILNKKEYETIALASGTTLAFCAAEEADCDEVQIDEAQWCAIGSVVWSGKTIKQGGIP